MQQFIIGPEENGCRLDRVIRKKLHLMPLSAIYTLFRKGNIRIGGKKAAQDYRLIEGDILDINVDKSEIAAPVETPENDTLAATSFFKKNFLVLFEDANILACNKPSGLVVHPGTGHTRRDTLIDLATSYLRNKKTLPAGDEIALVHRLDRDTSGVILIAKNKRTVRLLHETFKDRSIVKEYRALCHHRPPEYDGTITIGIAKTHERNSGTKMRVDDEGEEAVSRYQIRSFENDISHLSVWLETGKTHQIRVQMQHVGCPIIGDVRYGNPELDDTLFGKKPHRLYLHAYRLTFRHPHTHKNITIEAPLPKEFAELLNRSVE